MSKILGLSFFYHDSAAVLLENGIPLAMAEEERFSRVKHDYGFPFLAIDFVLKAGSVKPEELDWVVYYEKPFAKFDRIMKTFFATFPFSPMVFIEGIKSLFITKLWIRELIAKKTGVASDKVLFSDHHLSHAASAFFCSPFEKAAILTVDGVGEWPSTTIGLGDGKNIEITKKIHFPHSLGLLYSAFTAFLGFQVNEGEYKVMGMAPYGKPKYADKVKKLITFFSDGSYKLNLEYFTFHRSTTSTFSQKFVDLFGPARKPESKFFTRDSGWPSYFGPRPSNDEFEKLAQEQEYYADVAASIQEVLEEAVIKLANEAYKLTGADKLCLAGGVALNSVANYKILKNTPFKEIFIQPAAGDGGGALGAALAVWNIGLKGERGFILEHAYYGESYGEDEIVKDLKESGVKNFERMTGDDELVEVVAEELTKGKVIGWFQDRFEWGPRALGSRSIIADPRRNEMKEIVNTKIKFREPYRPFAPSVLAEHAKEFFEIDDIQKYSPANFMLYVVPVKKDKHSVIPAVTHVDGTARPQLVFEQSSPLYWSLINRFHQKTKVPMILNTSFNLRGEPIVNRPLEAINTFRKSEMDILVLGNLLIRREQL